MKKGIACLMMIGTLIGVSFLSSCSKKEDPSPETNDSLEQEEKLPEKDLEQEIIKRASVPDISQIRSICELATLECYYHNVAKSIKEKGKGLSHIGEKERVFWIEYSGVARFGINVSKVTMETKGNEILITIPKAELLGLSDHAFA